MMVISCRVSADVTFQAEFGTELCVGDAFIEGVGDQYAFMVRFIERGLLDAFGGNAAATAGWITIFSNSTLDL